MRRFAGTAVTASTMHALAYPSFGRPLEHRLRNSRPVFSSVKQQTIGLPPRYRFPASSGATSSTLTSAQALRLVEDTVTAFIHSAAKTITPQTVPVPASLGPLTPRGRNDLTTMVAHYADKYWADQTNPTGTIRPTHDTYLKQFQLTRPVLPYEYVMLDEAQDTDPVTIAILTGKMPPACTTDRRRRREPGDLPLAGSDQRDARVQRHTGGSVPVVAVRRCDRRSCQRMARVPRFRTPGAVGRPGAESSVWPSVADPRSDPVPHQRRGAVGNRRQSTQRSTDSDSGGERKTKELVSLAQAAIDLQNERKDPPPRAGHVYLLGQGSRVR